MKIKETIFTAMAILGSPILVFYAMLEFGALVLVERSKGEP